jgi:hypothetical protein
MAFDRPLQALPVIVIVFIFFKIEMSYLFHLAGCKRRFTGQRMSYWMLWGFQVLHEHKFSCRCGFLLRNVTSLAFAGPSKAHFRCVSAFGTSLNLSYAS